MAKRRVEGAQRLLEAWEPPSAAGAPIGCVATTFTFDATFFEEHCLSRFLRLETDPREDGAAYLINREEKLAETSVCVLVDRSNAQGSGSVRWDVLPVTVPGQRILHAKVSVLAWQRWIRVLIGSANLTEPGYRKNQEVFGVLDFREDGEVPVAVLEQILGFLEGLSALAPGSPASPGPKARLLVLVRNLRAMARPWATAPSKRRDGPRPLPVLLGPLAGFQEPVLTRLGQEMREHGGPAHSACVVSPFFDQSTNMVYPGTTALLAVLTDRGSRAVEFLVPFEPLPTGQIRLRAPRSLVQPGRKSAELSVYPVNEMVDRDMRPLHAKSVWLWNDRWHAYMIGSSNFTGAGLGLANAPNVEANVAYIFPEDGRMVDVMEATLPDSEEKVTDFDAVRWEATDEIDGEDPGATAVLPSGFEEALYEPREEGGVLTLHVNPPLPETWAIEIPGTGAPVYSSGQWAQAHRQKQTDIPWHAREIPRALTVIWSDAQDTPQSAPWPVNVTNLHLLPPPDALRDLPLETLIAILGSRLPLHEAVARAQRGSAGDPGPGGTLPELDPLRRVRTETFLLQRTRRVARAIEQLVETLNRPIVHEDALVWRLRGPVGPLALARALNRDARSPGEAAFLLSEVVRALHRVDAAKISQGVDVGHVRRAVDTLRVEIEQMALARLAGDAIPAAMADYVRRLLEGARR